MKEFIGMLQPHDKLVFDDFRTHCVNTVGEPFMAPAGQYVFAEMLGISEHFTAGSGAPRSESELP